MNLSRRKFFTLAGTTAAGVTLLSPLEAFYARVARGQVARGTGYGPLSPKLPENADELKGVILGGVNLETTPLLELPPGFNYTAISFTGQSMSDGGTVPSNHDGMAAFQGSNNTTILVRNHEVGSGGDNPVVASSKYDQIGGGTTTLIIGSDRRVKTHYASLAGTIRNCAGGPTPWGSWISCEENVSVPGPSNPTLTKKHGYNFEVPATADIQVADPVPLVAMGRFNHEAIAVDPATGWVYETEDRGDSCFYRFRPNQKGNLRSGGVLEALKISDSRAVNVHPVTGSVNTSTGYLGLKGVPLSTTWVKIEDVDPVSDTVRIEAQSKGAAIFKRGEGAWYGNGVIYFACTSGGNANQGQIFAYNPNNNTVTLVVESTNSDELNAPDNITVAPFGDLFLCEDGSGSEYVIGVNQSGELYRFATNAINGSEFAGVCFSPDGKTMFVNIQDPGITLAIWGPWTRKRT
ncbi:MAG: PhoX family protein [Aphanothece sp. CMT-3BRIN-NPC111]|nr:PhoX family protein [Aphanothece sp. CMT-3BRIN-NPC111]